MGEAEERKIAEMARSLSREEMAVVLRVVPMDMLWAELERKITDLCDFKDSFDSLAKKSYTVATR